MTYQATNLNSESAVMGNGGGCPRNVMVKALECQNVVSEFELLSHPYIHFLTLREDTKPLILPAML